MGRQNRLAAETTEKNTARLFNPISFLNIAFVFSRFRLLQPLFLSWASADFYFNGSLDRVMVILTTLP